MYYEEFLNLIIDDCEFFGFKISDIDQLILALIFRFGVILVQRIGRQVKPCLCQI